jgi:uncharacterized protein (UPF0248 family)
MVYDILAGLKKNRRLLESLLVLADRSSLDGKKRIPGSLIREVQRSFIVIESGETGQEAERVPLDKIMEIRSGGRILFRKGRRIERIYPR